MASNWYVSSVAYTSVAQLAVSTAYVIGNIVRQLATPAVGSERCFRCTTAGTSAGTEAAWTLTKGATTTQGTAVFTEVTGNETYQAPGAWAAPMARLGNVSGWWASGDTAYVAANHSEATAATSSAGGATSTSSETRILCVDSTGTGHVPPQAGDLRTTAVVAVSGNFNSLSIAMGLGYVYGVTFSAISGSFPGITLGSSGAYIKFENCVFSHSVSGSVTLSSGAIIDWINCQWQPGTNSNSLQISAPIFRWRNTTTMAAVLGANALSGGIATDSIGSVILVDGLDFSALAHTRIFSSGTGGSIIQMRNCKLHASTGANAVSGIGSTIDALSTDSAGNTNHIERVQYFGALTTDAAVVHTAGASDGTTTISWKIVTNANPRWSWPFEAFQIAQWNALTGSSKTVSFEAIVNAAAVLNNDQLWMDVDYLGTAASVLGAGATASKANALATAAALTASTQAWDSLATSRANSTAKALGDAMAVSSNSGRVFFCTTAGTTSGSLPAGYATAVDGGSVTDGTAVFRAGCRMTVSLSITPQVAGLIRVTPKIGVASSTCYIDPLLTVT